MILDKKSYDELEKQIAEWELAGKEEGGSVKDVSDVLKKLVSITKMSDKRNLDEITALLVYIIRTINDGQESVLELCECLYDEFDYRKTPDRGKGETGMVNPDGTFVTLKELGIEDE